MSHSPPLHRMDPTEQDIALTLSPSKALAHQRTTQSWSLITTWLTSLFSPAPVPPFEHNTATLTYLQSLMDANIRADHRQRLLQEVRVEQLRRYEEYEAAAKGSPERMLLRDLKGALSQEARANLEDMARVSVILGCMPSLDSLSLAEEDVTTTAERRIMELTQELFRLQNEVEELSSLKQSFDDERRGKEEKIWELREDAAAVEDDDLPGQAIETGSESSSARIPLDTLLAQTTHFNTSTKQLTLKIKEYQDRINGLNRSLEVQRQRECDITIEDIQRREDVLQRERVEIEKLQTKLREYHGLPSDLDASREEVRRAQGELEEWRRRRESAFETIGGAR